MKRVALLIGLGLVAGCQETPEPSNVGRYQVVVTSDGAMRVDSVTGKTHLMVQTDTPPTGTYATMGGKPLVWAEVKVNSPY